MGAAVRRSAAIALALLVASVATACGGSDAAGGGATAGSAQSAPVSRPYDTALQAALGFGDWFAHDDDEYCNQPYWTLNGRLPKSIVDSYSCHDMISARQLRDHCDNGGGGSAALRHVKLGPGRLEYTAKWNQSVNCDRGSVPVQRGTYRIVVQKYSNGWAATSYKLLTGPGAGTSG